MILQKMVLFNITIHILTCMKDKNPPYIVIPNLQIVALQMLSGLMLLSETFVNCHTPIAYQPPSHRELTQGKYIR